MDKIVTCVVTLKGVLRSQVRNLGALTNVLLLHSQSVHMQCAEYAGRTKAAELTAGSENRRDSVCSVCVMFE